MIPLWLRAMLSRLTPDRPQYVLPETLHALARAEMRQGWDEPDADRCGPWQGALVTEAARTLRWRER